MMANRFIEQLGIALLFYGGILTTISLFVFLLRAGSLLFAAPTLVLLAGEILTLPRWVRREQG
jgi:hypothetical protein